MKWQSKVVVGVAILLAASAGWALKPSAVVVQDTVRVELPPTELLDRIDALQIESGGWRARFEGREERPPSVIYTVRPPPDTVFAAVRVGAGGWATLAPFIRADSLYTPEIWEGIDLSDCDEGFSISGGDIVCDKARLGHVQAFLRLTGGYTLPGAPTSPVGAATGLEWAPSYRSTWGVEVAIDVTGRVYVGLQKGLRIF